MGSGKTTVGRKLAGMLQRDFVDTDQELINRTGVTIPHIFEIEGEEGFRDRETRLLTEICQLDDVVVSTGGGIVIRSANREMMRNSGNVVYLDIPMDLLWDRLRGCQNRPLLQVANPRQRIEELHEEREAMYIDSADICIKVQHGDSATRTARRIERLLQNPAEFEVMD
jgi:shikimate kinase